MATFYSGSHFFFYRDIGSHFLQQQLRIKGLIVWSYCRPTSGAQCHKHAIKSASVGLVLVDALPLGGREMVER